MKRLADLTFKWMLRFDMDVEDCIDYGQTMIVAGPDGRGKVKLLERLKDRYPNGGTACLAHLYQLTSETDPIKNLRDIIDSLPKEKGQEKDSCRCWSRRQAIDCLATKLISKDYRLLLFTSAHSANPEFFDLIQQLQRLALAQEHPIGVVYAFRGSASELVSLAGGAEAMTHVVHTVPALSIGESLEALNSWCNGISDLMASIGKKDEEAISLGNLIFQRTRGNFATLATVARHKNRMAPDAPLTRKLFNRIVDKMRGILTLSSEEMV